MAAQALFPMTAQFEMAGNLGENDITHATQIRIDRAWPLIAERVAAIPEYVDMFAQAFADVSSPRDITIVHIGNALGAFIISEWTSIDTIYDQNLRNGTPLPPQAAAGKELFFGDAGCSACHSGPLFSDRAFRALGLPAFGPGRTRRFDPIPRDVGRMGKSDRLEDAYRFKTPSLRNVAVTAPYGHNGAYPTLERMIKHHLDPLAERNAWQRSDAALPPAPHIAAIDFVIQSDTREMARQSSVLDIDIPSRTQTEIDQIIAFLETLTDPSPYDRPLGRPETVPSGLPVD